MKGVQQLDSTIKVEFPKMIQSTTQSLQSIITETTIDEANVKLRILQALGSTPKATPCIEKHQPEIEKYVAAVKYAYKNCGETATNKLDQINTEGTTILVRPSDAFTKKVTQEGEKCLKEISKNPSCANQIFMAEHQQFQEMRQKAEGFIARVMNLNTEAVKCFAEKAAKSIQELDILSKKIKTC